MPHATRPRTPTPRRMGRALAAGAVLALAVAGTAHAESIVAVGAGQADVRLAPSDRRDDGAIRAAVSRARAVAVPRALVNARTQAALIAQGAGLALGPIQAVEQSENTYFFYAGPFGGRFGPNRYCGRVVNRRVTRRDGMRRVIRRERRECSIPDFATVTVSVTFAAAPAR